MNNRKCPNCNLINLGAAAQCERCGYPLTDEHAAAGAYTPGDLGAQPGAPTSAYAPGEAPGASAEQTSTQHDTGLPAPYVAPFSDVGTALGQAWNLYTKNFMLIAKLVLFAAIPFALGQAAMAYRLQTDGGWAFSSGLNVAVFTLVRWSLIPPTIIYAVLQVLRTGVAPGVGESYRWGAGRWLRVTLGLLLAWLASFGPMALMGILLAAGAIAQSTALLGLAFLAFLVMLIPCVLLSLGFSLVTPVVALEYKWPLDALTRSWQLTKGVRWRIFGTMFVMGLLVAIVGLVIGLALGGIFGLFGSPFVAGAISEVATEVIGQIMTVTLLVIYLGLLAPDEQRHTVDALGAPAQG